MRIGLAGHLGASATCCGADFFSREGFFFLSSFLFLWGGASGALTNSSLTFPWPFVVTGADPRARFAEGAEIGGEAADPDVGGTWIRLPTPARPRRRAFLETAPWSCCATT